MAVLLNVIANAIHIELVNNLLKRWKSKAKPEPERPNQEIGFIFVFLSYDHCPCSYSYLKGNK
jgi:hypothetical protein